MPDIADGDTVEIQGSATLPYKLRNVAGVYSCSCPAWINAGGPIDLRTCKHLKQYRGDAAELARVGSVAKMGKPTPAKSADGDDEEGGQGAPPVLLAHKWELDQDLVGWWMSEKLDGVRAWWDGTQFLSRLGNTFLAPSWFTKDLPKHPLDGELWLARKEFQRCVSIVRSAGAGELWREVKYLIFDAPAHADGFEGRVAYVNKLFGNGQSEFAAPVEHVQCKGYDHLKTELARVEALGGEGLMLRQPQSKYIAGRSTTLLKVKTFHDAEGRVLSHEPGKGKHKGRLGALVVEMHDGTRFNVGTGFTDVERQSPPPVGSIITYRYQELTKDGVPRFPSFVGVAIDKTAPTKPTAPPMPGPPKPATKPAPSPSTSQIVTQPLPPAPGPSSASSASTAAAAGGGAGFRRFEMAEKFWAIKLDGTAHTVKFGKIGTNGQEKTKDFGDAGTAKKEYDKLVAEKTRKGYEEVDGADDDDEEAPTVPMALTAAAPVAKAPVVSALPVAAHAGQAAHAGGSAADVVKRLSGWRKKSWADVEAALDERAVFIKPDGSRVEGRDACVESYKDFLTSNRVIRFSTDNERVDEWANTAIAWCTWEMSYAAGGRPLREKGTETLALTNASGGWRVVWRKLEVASASAKAPVVVDDDDDDDEEEATSDDHGDTDDDE